MFIAITAALIAHAQSLSALDQAQIKKQDVINLHTAASAKFLSNLADSAATNGLLSVLDQWQAAAEESKKAEQAVADSQNTLVSAQQKLEKETQKIMGPLTRDVKKEIEQRQKDAQMQLLRKAIKAQPGMRLVIRATPMEPMQARGTILTAIWE